MNILRAEHFLKTYSDGSQKLADVYDSDDMLRDVLGTLFPEFEYPDFSYKTIEQIRSQYFANPLPLTTAP